MKKHPDVKNIMRNIKQSTKLLSSVQKPPIPLQVLTLLSEQKKIQF